ncbi:MAG: hypothetical protein WC628_07275 [Candidatus Omnitrophota bacterium]
MNRIGKAPIIALIALIIISLALAGGGFFLFQKERARAANLEEQVKQISEKQKIAEEDLRKSRGMISELQVKLQGSAAKIDDLTASLDKEKTERLNLAAKQEQLKADLEQQKALRLELEKKFAQAQDEGRKTQNSLKELEAQKKELEQKLKGLEENQPEGVELGNIVVTPELSAAKPGEKAVQPGEKQVSPKSGKTQAVSIPAALEGKVLVVNKEYNFAVINLGSKNGIDVDDSFLVYRNNKYLGEIKVEKIHDAMAAAGFVTKDLKDKLSEGDKVVQKGK